MNTHLNIPALKEFLVHLLTLTPPQFNMHWYATKCGTAACLAGHAYCYFKNEPIQNLYEKDYREFDPIVWVAKEFAQEKFGMTPGEARIAFMKEGVSQPIKHLKDTTLPDAIEFIRRVIQCGRVHADLWTAIEFPDHETNRLARGQ